MEIEEDDTPDDVEARAERTVDQCDFMTWESPAQYDAVIINPPFSNGADIDHVIRAYQFLKVGGVIVAIMGEGAFFRSDKKATHFRAWLDQHAGESEQLTSGTFAQSGTNVNTRLVIIRKDK